MQEYSDLEDGGEYVPQSPAYIQQQQSSEASIMKMADPKVVLDQFKMEILGFEWNNVDEKWKKVAKPMMNEQGVHELMIDLRPFISTLATLSSLDAEEVEAYAKAKMRTIVKKIAIKGEEEWGLSPLNFNTISDLCLAVVMTLRRGVAGKEKRWIGSMYDEKLIGRGMGFQQDPYGNLGTQGYDPNKQKKGIMSMLNPFAKK